MFSVVIPTYNRVIELSLALDSVLSQTFREFEVIVVDNGSIDDTSNIVQEYAKRDSRVRYIWQVNSGSPAGSRNTGIRNAQYKWISFLDSDDLWHPKKLECVKEYIERYCENNFNAVCHWEERYVNGQFAGILEHGSCLDKNQFESLLTSRNCLSPSAMTVKRSVFDEVGYFDESEDLFCVEDYDLWLRLVKNGGSIGIIKTPLGVFNLHGSNMSAKINLIYNNQKNVMKKHIANFQVDSAMQVKILNKLLSNADYLMAREHQKNGDFQNALKALQGSIISYPWMLKKWLALALCLVHSKR